MARLRLDPTAYVTWTPTAAPHPFRPPPIERVDARDQALAEAWAFVLEHQRRIKGIAYRILQVLPGDQRVEAIEHVSVAIVEQWPALKPLLAKASAPEKMATTVITMTVRRVLTSWSDRRNFGAAERQDEDSIDASPTGDGLARHEMIAAPEEDSRSIRSDLLLEIIGDSDDHDRKRILDAWAGRRVSNSTLRAIGRRQNNDWGRCYAASC